MGRGKSLTEHEIKIILNLKKDNVSVAQIAKIVERSRCAVMNLLKDPENYGKKKSPGRPRALSEREERTILRLASNSEKTAREIAAEAGIATNIWNIQRVIKRCNHIKRKKIQRKPPLTQTHKEERMRFAREHLKWKKRWRKVIFTDEKRFCLDGPDGWSYFFHDLRKDPLVQMRRQMGGGGLMVWAGIGYKGKTEIRFISGKMKSKDYIKLIDEEIRERGTGIAAENFIMQQDNAAVHTAHAVKTYFTRQKINVLEWPSRSPDLNIIENVWGQLSRVVYRGGKQYQTITDLKDAIKTAWDTLPRKYIKQLYKSLPNRLLEVIEKKGGCTHY